MATRIVWTPEAVLFNTSAWPQLKQYVISSIPRSVLAFDASASETCYLCGIVPQGITGTITLVVKYRMASATTGGLAFDAAVEAITPGDVLDTDTSNSFDSANTGTDSAVPGTAGYVDELGITLSSVNSWAAGDAFRIALSRNVAHATDTATGDCEVLEVELRDGA